MEQIVQGPVVSDGARPERDDISKCPSDGTQTGRVMVGQSFYFDSKVRRSKGRSESHHQPGIAREAFNTVAKAILCPGSVGFEA
jgi:hypothetical protein